ncbi:hypothetical protein [Xenorhabdus griffiniae]|uniref:Uncharacterized protein n=1 Tax=Xenorhabdus griffiniae TaxID=351672 RepID=A0ABY9XJS8_9GAMM|nr:hypothetical protein [Xenorhabdus griffiniae]MBD1228944.1 hypothetical protein [Xenorhabdus griffiniae]MBE8589299.1 hypothetical protein [Xenorhabdus griffiniae]WMV73189.1 hypothetical protein QL128_03870 [Xenorhabdus griffiniae]WNH02868.1 hypothetical protein QL112_003875 [Xenorhabdus griffiniae]
MPFKEPFTRKLIIGDLVYGLHSERVRYLREYQPFKGSTAAVAVATKILPSAQVLLIDQFITPPELYFKDELTRMEMEEQYNYMHTTKRLPYQKSFMSHLKNHPKYNTALKSADKVFSRKCKGGLSWVTTSNEDTDLLKNNNIHFILDGIDMRYVVNKIKYPGARTDITSHELRWVYRNRYNPNVQRKIQFWLDGKPTSPPWESVEGKEIWRLYTPRSEITSAF